jgi:hypothetical protein
MKNIAACAVFAWAMATFGMQSVAAERPAELARVLPAANLAGQATLRFWGFEVYQANLWVEPGFQAAQYGQSAFALELRYLRDFKGADIAQRSIREMQRQGTMDAAQEARWEAQLRAVFPDVKAGDRITGINQAGVGAVFLRNGRPLGTIADPAFAKTFFGIWLSDQTSEPTMRAALISRAQTVTVTAQPQAPTP